MSADRSDERASARMARASWIFASKGARRHVERATEWARAEGLEALMRERDERASKARYERDLHRRALMLKRGARNAPPPPAPPRALTNLEVNARAFGTRALRSLCALSIPCALIAYPVYTTAQGDPGPLLLWPLAYGYFVWDGWMFRDKYADSDEEVRAPAPAVFADEPVAAKRPARVEGFAPTPEEAAVIHRITAWEEYAAPRKLHEVIPGQPVIDESGLLIPITFAGQWTPAKLDAQLDQVRALLAVPDEVRTQVKPGGTADRALIRVRTRIRDLDLSWTPEREGIGLDADTGAVVRINTDDRILVAGTSGSGKSVALRVLMASALAKPDAALVIIDLKKAEGSLWRHTARVETDPDGIQEVVAELIAEMKEREDIMESRDIDLWEATPERPNITVAVDEGAELMEEVSDAITGFRSLARRARAAGIRLWWGTQKPTMTGNGPGLDSQIAGQLTTKVCLAVAGSKEARVVLGDDATAGGWHAEDLQMGGWALVRDLGANRKPDPVRVWFMEKEHVKSLPPRQPWKRARTSLAGRAASNVLAVALQLSEGLNGVSTARLMEATGMSDTEVHAAMRVYNVLPEPNAFAMGSGEKARGYRRANLEAAKKAQEE